MNCSKSVFSGSVAAGLVALALLMSGPAQADVQGIRGAKQQQAIMDVDYRRGGERGWYAGPGWHYERLKPRQVRRSLRHRGFRKIEILDRKRSVYIVRARGWRGHPVRMVVDAHNAEILRMRPVGKRRHW
ncbi:hypothetical protein [Roseibium sp. RKSG952]|uniref:hypothetical protein n=1 Tax=Roseibium sp. RKSG952 TaxID=2529384 RepID=UPI0018AD2711|nr:hypothetical protein [Roseibium sp. RKSG952]